MPFFKRVETSDRTISTNQPPSCTRYCNNKIVNSKYTIWTFLPFIFFAHIKRFMNSYFILIGILQLWDAVSPVNPLTTWAPICLIFMVAFIREGIDDYIQHKQDEEINGRIFKIIREKKLVNIPSEEIIPGDIVVLERNQESPCDLAVVYTSNHEGSCCIETANLDGETNLKERRALIQTQELGPETIQSNIITIKCSSPNAELYKFDSNLYIEDLDSQVFPLSEYQLIQQGVFLRNASFIYGIACYTGKETKMGLNSECPPIKWTQIEKFLNKVSICIFLAQILLATINGYVGNTMIEYHSKHSYYLHLDLDTSIQPKYQWIIMYIRSYLLTSVMIPVSLKVTIDVCKYVYALWIKNDAKILDPITHCRTKVNNTSVIEDLGAIEYIFTDKTGTLTENEMKLKKICVQTNNYGHSMDADDIFNDRQFKDDLIRKDPTVIIATIILSLCHSLTFIQNKQNVTFEGVSPEEIAFLNGLENLKIKVRFIPSSRTYSISMEHYNIPPIFFNVIQILPFSYKRKLMSVLVKDVSTGDFLLLTKGAHEKVFDSCDNTYEEFPNQVEQISSQGLRVMALSYKKVDLDEYNRFQTDFQQASQSMENRNEIIDDVFISFEEGQTLIGITAIEDKLQNEVPETIEMLREAGIKIWMVTGDLMNTAIKIAKTTKLVSNDGPLIHLTSRTIDTDVPTVLKEVLEYVNSIDKPFYLVIDGSSPLTSEYLNQYVNDFGVLASKAKCVICARTMPKQKALYVESIKRMGFTTMSIGDGGNDVTMLRTAHIGIGIAGKEGRQAAIASDFAINRFSFVKRLVLIHGRYAFYRTSWLTQFCFYKSILLALLQVMYMLYNGFSAVSFFADFNLMSYNAIFTLLPVLFFLLDKDVDEVTVYLHPYIYCDTRTGAFLNIRTVFWWIVRSIFQALVIVGINHIVFTSDFMDPLDGTPSNLAEVQQVTYSSLILIVLITTTFDTQNFTSLNFIFIWGNWVLYHIITTIANGMYKLSITREVYLVMWRLLSSPNMWVIIFSHSLASTLPIMYIQALFASYVPSNTQVLRYYEVTKLSRFEPIYLIDLSKYPEGFDGNSVNKIQGPTIWETTHNICSPLCACCAQGVSYY